MLLKGLKEVAATGRPLAAAEIILVPIAYAADLPTPDEVICSFDDLRPSALKRPTRRATPLPLSDRAYRTLL
jgi:DNA polymerase-3 subunit gamma/tau